jgi:hypothetical protein
MVRSGAALVPREPKSWHESQRYKIQGRGREWLCHFLVRVLA